MFSILYLILRKMSIEKSPAKFRQTTFLSISTFVFQMTRPDRRWLWIRHFPGNGFLLFFPHPLHLMLILSEIRRIMQKRKAPEEIFGRD